MKKLLAPLSVLAGLAAVLLPMEVKYRYYFLQDDNRDFGLPWLVHAWRGLMQGEPALYNFHQYAGYPSLGSAQTGTLYPPGYLAMFLSEAFFGHVFAAVDILVILHLALGALGWLYFLRRLDVGPVAAVWGALACSLNSFVIYGGASWLCISVLAAWFPWTLYFGLEFLRGPRWWTWAGLLAARLLLFYYGYIQYFVYAAALEMMVLAGVWLATPGIVPKARRWLTPLYYVASWIYVTLLSAPLLIPMWKQVQGSAMRRSVQPLPEFIAYSMNTLSWTAGLLNPFSFKATGNIGEALPFLGHVGYLTILLATAALYLSLRGRIADERQRLILVMLGLFVITLALSIDYVAIRLYHVPILNRFRWPFKLLVFANYFQVLLAALGLDHFLESGLPERSRRAAAGACFALLLANCWLLYVGTRPKPFRTHYDLVPIEEPLRPMLRDGRIFTLGYDVWDRQSAHGLGFDYATLFGLYHFGGYDPLILQANYDLALQLTYAASFEGPPGTVPWARLRQWGVRWYVVGNQHWDYDAALRDQGITFVQRDARRAIFHDPQAKPLVFWEDGRTDPFDVQIRTNSIVVNTSGGPGGPLCLNFLFHPRFAVEIDGQPGRLAANAYGQMLLEVPAGRHAIVARYQDQDFRLGLWIAALGIAIICVHLALAGWRAGPRHS